MVLPSSAAAATARDQSAMPLGFGGCGNGVSGRTFLFAGAVRAAVGVALFKGEEMRARFPLPFDGFGGVCFVQLLSV